MAEVLWWRDWSSSFSPISTNKGTGVESGEYDWDKAVIQNSGMKDSLGVRLVLSKKGRFLICLLYLGSSD